jgi:C-terminal processing protease CtpA/Prc
MIIYYGPRRILKALLLLLIVSSISYSQTPPSSEDRDNARTMLNAIKSDLQKYYYDPQFGGMDLDQRFKTAEEKINQATSLAQLLGVVGQVLLDLNDSHTFFLPPGRTYKTDYGWQMKAIGDRCYVVAVKPKSDAEAKGLQEGDEIVSIDGLKPTRDNEWKILYLYHQIRPRPGMRLTVIKPNGEQRQLDVAAKIQDGKKVVDLSVYGQGYDTGDLIREAEKEEHLNRQRNVEIGDVFVWKMPGFDQDAVQVRDMIERVKKRKALILDLRGNGGGYEQTLLALIGNVFDHDVKLGQLKRRKEQKEMIAKSRGNEAFAGKILVLIDSQSGSAAELFARVVQLEKRGTVIGDRSAGAVMRSRVYSHTIGIDRFIPYAASVTDPDILMTDGKSLERVGVVPDELKLPSASDLANKHDPVLAHALSLVAIDMTPEKAGMLFPLEWKK